MSVMCEEYMYVCIGVRERLIYFSAAASEVGRIFLWWKMFGWSYEHIIIEQGG